MDSLALVLDSTVYKKTPRVDSELFKLLRKQCRIGNFRLFIPAVVDQEYLTWIDEQVEESFAGLQKSIRSLNRLMPKQEVLSGFDIVTYVTSSQLTDLKKQIYENWTSFKRDTKAVVVPIAERHGPQVMNAYFKGDKPFSNRKNRGDIPDAFLMAAVMDIVGKEKSVFLVTQDRKFADSFSEIPHVIIANDLAAFFQIENVRVRSGIKVSEDAVQFAKIVLLYYKDELEARFSTIVRDETERTEIAEQLLESFMEDLDPFPTVIVKEMRLETSLVQQVSDHVFIVPFSANIQIEISYLIERGRLAQLGKERVEKLISREDHDLTYYSVSEAFPTKLKGNFTVSIPTTDPATWKDPSKDIVITVENIGME